jgi:hypothetical protein
MRHHRIIQTLCFSLTRTAVTLTINAAPAAPTGDATQDFCATTNPTIDNLAASGSGIKWYDAAEDGNLLQERHLL